MYSGETAVLMLAHIRVADYQRIRRIDTRSEQDRAERQRYMQSSPCASICMSGYGFFIFTLMVLPETVCVFTTPSASSLWTRARSAFVFGSLGRFPFRVEIAR